MAQLGFIFSLASPTPSAPLTIGSNTAISTLLPTALQAESVTATSASGTMPPTSTPVPTATPLFYSVINVRGSDKLNIRVQPGYSYDIIGKILNTAQDIQITGVGVQADNTVWLPVVYDDISGWIDSYYLAPSNFVGFNVYNVVLRDIKGNGSGAEITVSPGEQVVVTYDFQVYSDPCPGCITQLVTGLGTPGSHGGSCAYLLMGRELQKQYGQEPQVVLMMPIREGLNGVQKMSKSLNNYIGVHELPNQMFGKLMSISDDLMWRYFDLLSFRPIADIQHTRKK